MPFPVMALARDNMAQEILGHAAHYDHIVIDGPPRAEALSRAVIIASERRWCMNRNWPATNPTYRSITHQERTAMAYRVRPSG